MRREDWVIMVMSLVIVMWVGSLLLPSIPFASPLLLFSRGNPSKEVMLLSKPTCTPACAAVAGSSACKGDGGSGGCEPTTSGCVHKSPQPNPRHQTIAAVADSDPQQCVECGKQWLQWERVRVYECLLHCESHVFSDKVYHEPKYRYDEITARCEQ